MFIFVIYKVIFKELEIFVIFEFIYYFQMDVKSEDPDENFNPWIVNNLDEFLFFCCPECDTQSPNKALFINHALIGGFQLLDLIITELLKVQGLSLVEILFVKKYP